MIPTTDDSHSPDENCRVAVVALCNRYALNQAWLPACAGTWPDRLLPSCSRYLVSDGSLNAEELTQFKALTGFSSRDPSETNEEIGMLLGRYPATATMREQCVFYRRIIDFSLLFRDFTHVLNVDTDIMVREKVALPASLPSFAFCVDDCPGYSCSASVVLRRKIVTGLNAGFLLFKPSEILDNLGFIEDVTRRFIRRGKTPWWAEQTLWALIAGSVASSVAVFSSESVAIVSGLRKRSLSDIRANRTRYFVRSKSIDDAKEIQQVVANAPVIHFAGPGKPWIKAISTESATEPPSGYAPQELMMCPVPCFDSISKFKLMARLFVQHRVF